MAEEKEKKVHTVLRMGSDNTDPMGMIVFEDGTMRAFWSDFFTEKENTKVWTMEEDEFNK